MGKNFPDGYYTLVGHLICIFEHISLPLAHMSGQNQDKPCKFFLVTKKLLGQKSFFCEK